LQLHAVEKLRWLVGWIFQLLVGAVSSSAISRIKIKLLGGVIKPT